MEISMSVIDPPYNAIAAFAASAATAAAASAPIVAEILAADAIMVAGVAISPALAAASIAVVGLGAGAAGLYAGYRYGLPAATRAARWVRSLRITTQPRAVVTQMTPEDIAKAWPGRPTNVFDAAAD
jgi:hypothetical protein